MLDPSTAITLPGPAAGTHDDLLRRSPARVAVLPDPRRPGRRRDEAGATARAARADLGDPARAATTPTSPRRCAAARCATASLPRPTPRRGPDAWKVLQYYRTPFRSDSPRAQQVGLDHLMTATTDIGGSPYVGAPRSRRSVRWRARRRWHTVRRRPAVSYQYALPGTRRTPAGQLLGAQPAARRRVHRPPPGRRRARHRRLGPRWLTGLVTRDAVVNDQLDRPARRDADRDATAEQDDPYEGMIDSDVGHGTFICGLIRQKCPDALHPLRAGDERRRHRRRGRPVEALTLLPTRQQNAVQTGQTPTCRRCFALARLLPRVRHRRPRVRSGTARPRCAGSANAASPLWRRRQRRRPTGRCIPAAFTPWAGGLITARKLRADHQRRRANPNHTVALFSNAGEWVSCHRPGAALVSTLPDHVQRSGQPSFSRGRRQVGCARPSTPTTSPAASASGAAPLSRPGAGRPAGRATVPGRSVGGRSRERGHARLAPSTMWPACRSCAE